MSVYMTEEEQIEAIKKWWQHYGTIITVLLSLVLLSISGYKYWIWHQNKISVQASVAYEQLMAAFSNQDEKAVKSYANQLITDYDNTVYAHAARLALAKIYVETADLNKAINVLTTVAENSPMPALKEVAHIRIARLMTARKTYKQALAELNQVNEKSYLPLINELKGDIYTAIRQPQKAMAAYKEAMKGIRQQGLGNFYLEMKTSELAALTQSKNEQKEVSQVS